jgi:hypothetical protein
MSIGPEIASKKFAIFSWARCALSSGWRAKVCQEQVAKGMTKPEGSPNAQMTKSKRALLSSFGFRHSFVIKTFIRHCCMTSILCRELWY